MHPKPTAVDEKEGYVPERGGSVGHGWTVEAVD